MPALNTPEEKVMVMLPVTALGSSVMFCGEMR